MGFAVWIALEARMPRALRLAGAGLVLLTACSYRTNDPDPFGWADAFGGSEAGDGQGFDWSEAPTGNEPAASVASDAGPIAVYDQEPTPDTGADPDADTGVDTDTLVDTDFDSGFFETGYDTSAFGAT